MKEQDVHYPTISFIVHGYLPFDRAGVPIYVDKLSRNLASSRHFSVRNLAASRIGMVRKEYANHYEVQYLPVWPRTRELIRSSVLFTAAILFYGTRYIRKWGTNLIHGHTTYYGGIQALLLGLLTKTPVILTLHGYDRQGPFVRFLFRASRIIVQRHTLERVLVNRGFDRERIVVIPNCIEIRDAPSTKSREGTPRVVFVGRMDPFKRPDLFLDAVNLVLESGLRFQALLRGSGTLLEPLRRLVIDRCISDGKIRFEGLVAAPFADLGYGDIFVACSDIENYSSTSLLEAMERGMAVIATDVGETREIIEDGINGVLVKPTKENIAEAIITLIGDPARCLELGRCARAKIINEYAYEKLLRMHINTYKSVLSQLGE